MRLGAINFNYDTLDGGSQITAAENFNACTFVPLVTLMHYYLPGKMLLLFKRAAVFHNSELFLNFFVLNLLEFCFDLKLRN